jgi:hypothetical protein
VIPYPQIEEIFHDFSFEMDIYNPGAFCYFNDFDPILIPQDIIQQLKQNVWNLRMEDVFNESWTHDLDIAIQEKRDLAIVKSLIEAVQIHDTVVVTNVFSYFLNKPTEDCVAKHENFRLLTHTNLFSKVIINEDYAMEHVANVVEVIKNILGKDMEGLILNTNKYLDTTPLHDLTYMLDYALYTDKQFQERLDLLLSLVPGRELELLDSVDSVNSTVTNIAINLQKIHAIKILEEARDKIYAKIENVSGTYIKEFECGAGFYKMKFRFIITEVVNKCRLNVIFDRKINGEDKAVFLFKDGIWRRKYDHKNTAGIIVFHVN